MASPQENVTSEQNDIGDKLTLLKKNELMNSFWRSINFHKSNERKQFNEFLLVSTGLSQ
jgi:hypothetical protein